MRRILNVLALLALASAVGFAWAAESSKTQLLIEPAELAKILDEPDVRVVEARPLWEYSQGRIPGAVNVPAPASESLEANRQGFPIPTERAKELFRAAGIHALTFPCGAPAFGG